ncbi:MAG: polyisoprenyl-phosphate glycosyltransferase [Patescibacteria group bacterium]|nr:polyisoprenyl-phosphate glycosyltransferase [Patescibacteria group bacterium]
MKLSVIVPCYNEEKVLHLLAERLGAVFLELKADDYEIILVNDGSTDRTESIIKELSKNNGKYKAVHLSRNFGHQAALLAGLAHFTGDAAFLLDADLQDPPELIGRFIEKYNEGYEVVYGVKKARKENFFKKATYRLYYKILRMLAEIDIPLESGDFCLLSRRVVSVIISMPERNKFLRGLRSWVGFKQYALEYNRDKRRSGASKYTIRKLLKLSNDGIFGFSKVPLKVSFWLGIFICLGCFGAAIIFFILYLISDIHNKLPGYTSLILSILFFGGIQLFALGLIGGYIGRIYDTVRNRPEYIIKGKDNIV